MIDNIMNTIWELVDKECAKNWLKIYQLFKFIYDITTAGQKQFDYMVKVEALTKLLDFFLEGCSPFQMEK